MEQYKIYAYLDAIEDAYKEPVKRVDGLYRNPKDIIRTVEFYSNSQYLSGNRDELGREKPFYNIGNYRVTVAKVATDLDVKDIKFEPDSLRYSVQAMILNKKLFELLKEMNFSKVLNDAGLVRPKYGGVIFKKVEKKGKLSIEVLDWTKVDFDPDDVLGGAFIQTFNLQPSELIKRKDVWENVDEVLSAHAKFHKNKPAKIEIKEISGEFSEDFDPYIENGDEEKFSRMCFYIACVGKKKLFLYKEEEKEIDLMYLPWEAVGNSLGRGIWEDGFESQVWQNDAIISFKNAMDISGKVLLTTDSQKISGNAIVGADNGHIFQMEQGRTLNSLNLAPSSFPAFEKAIELWNNQYDKTASTFDANTGESPTANTPYSQTALLNQVANSPFEFQRETMGTFYNEMFKNWTYPYLKRKVKSEGIIVAEFDDNELEIIDDAMAEYNKKSYFKQELLKGLIPTENELEEVGISTRARLSKDGKKREIEIPSGFLDIDGKLTINITGELKNKQAILQSLDSIFGRVAESYNPQTGTYALLEDPTLLSIFKTIVDLSGAPVSIPTPKPKPATPAPEPQLA